MTDIEKLATKIMGWVKADHVWEMPCGDPVVLHSFWNPYHRLDYAWMLITRICVMLADESNPLDIRECAPHVVFVGPDPWDDPKLWTVGVRVDSDDYKETFKWLVSFTEVDVKIAICKLALELCK